MSANGANSLSSDSGHHQTLDRWSQRRLQRLNTEQGFREQRQASHAKSMSNNVNVNTPSTSANTTNSSSGSATTPSSASPAYRHDTPQQPPYHHHHPLPQQRNFLQHSDDGPNSAKRQPTMASSIHSVAGSANHNPSASQSAQQQQQQQQQIHQQQKQQQQAQSQSKDSDRSTPQPQGDDLTEEDVRQLVKDHKELREKYTKVKKYYFEKEDQVKQLQNSLAHQRIAQSRTSLDDSEYATRFNRLDGLIAQLSFSIRKSWKSVPSWLASAVNKDAIAVGKQEMTAVGRAFISHWLVQDVFDKYFHPDLDLDLSMQLKIMQKNIRRFAAPATVLEDEEYLTSKVVNWRLTTLESLQDILRLSQAQKNRAQLTDQLQAQLLAALHGHLDNPPVSDLDGGVHMICELAVAMLGHLPQESRDVSIEYFLPGSPINQDIMKIESGVPALNISVADDMAEHGSLKSANSDLAEAVDQSTADTNTRKRHMLSAFTGKKNNPPPVKQNSDSSTSLAQKDEQRVRLAVGIAAHVRERNILVRAPVFST